MVDNISKFQSLGNTQKAYRGVNSFLGKASPYIAQLIIREGKIN